MTQKRMFQSSVLLSKSVPKQFELLAVEVTIAKSPFYYHWLL
uniref:Uncharacterized protein n=1 Tax=Anguilla anguilla TaxID=7936 RepID=A0A0E9VSF0_ANGAN